MPHKGTPIRYGQKQPVRNRQQGAEVGYAGKPRSGCSQIWILEVSYSTSEITIVNTPSRAISGKA